MTVYNCYFYLSQFVSNFYLRQAVYASDHNDAVNLQAILQVSKIPVKQWLSCKD